MGLSFAYLGYQLVDGQFKMILADLWYFSAANTIPDSMCFLKAGQAIKPKKKKSKFFSHSINWEIQKY